MDWNAAAADWKQFRCEVRSRWRRLSDAQLDDIAGTRATLAGHLREIYGLSEDHAERQIRSFETINGSFRAVSMR
jgi:uncharacterized protein YjbJ (UPF0337 family)